MVKKLLILSACSWLSSCSPPMRIVPSSSIAGTYKLAQYSTASKSDPAPVGLITITAVDEDHVDLTATGTSNKAKITYSYQNVVVTQTDPNYLGEDTFSLVYKKKQIGFINSNEQGHYISLTPKPDVVLVADILAGDDQ